MRKSGSRQQEESPFRIETAPLEPYPNQQGVGNGLGSNGSNSRFCEKAFPHLFHIGISWLKRNGIISLSYDEGQDLVRKMLHN
jgi:hypothetical protein